MHAHIHKSSECVSLKYACAVLALVVRVVTFTATEACKEVKLRRGGP